MVSATIQHRAASRLRGGFTLVEAALATVIVGVGFVAALDLFGACSRQNATASRMTTAMLLAGQIREATMGLPFCDPVTGSDWFGPESGETLSTFDDIDDFDGQTLNPPIDATRRTLSELAQYTQVVSIMPVFSSQPSINTDETNLEIPKGAYTGAVRIRVRILYRARPADPQEEVYRASWIRLDE